MKYGCLIWQFLMREILYIYETQGYEEVFIHTTLHTKFQGA